MWRPLEVFLYDWWPILGEVRLLDRLSRMPVRIEYKDDGVGRCVAVGLAGHPNRQADALATTRVYDKSTRQET